MDKLWKVKTKNGFFVVLGIDEHSAKINFTITFPAEKIHTITPLEEKAVAWWDLQED